MKLRLVSQFMRRVFTYCGEIPEASYIKEKERFTSANLFRVFTERQEMGIRSLVAVGRVWRENREWDRRDTL